MRREHVAEIGSRGRAEPRGAGSLALRTGLRPVGNHRGPSSPHVLAEWLLYLAPMIRAGVLHVPFGTGRHAPIAAEDQARVIVGILENPSPHCGQVYPLYGPVEFTYAEIAHVLSRGLGWEVRYKQVSI